MNIIVYGCGCSITRSMFGEREIVDASLCEKHMHEHPEILKLLVETIFKIQNK